MRVTRAPHRSETAVMTVALIQNGDNVTLSKLCLSYAHVDVGAGGGSSDVRSTTGKSADDVRSTCVIDTFSGVVVGVGGVVVEGEPGSGDPVPFFFLS